MPPSPALHRRATGFALFSSGDSSRRWLSVSFIRWRLQHVSTSAPNTGRGSGRFLLGNGPGATGGDVVVELCCIPASTPTVSVVWSVSPTSVPTEIQQQIVSYI